MPDLQPPQPRPGLNDQQVEQIIGNLLRVGVLLAAAVVAVGGVVYLARHGTQPIATKYEQFHGEPDDFCNAEGVLREVFKFSGQGIIALGLLILLTTPVVRVIFSVFAFAVERDWKYVAITLIVLGVLLYSLIFATG